MSIDVRYEHRVLRDLGRDDILAQETLQRLGNMGFFVAGSLYGSLVVSRVIPGREYTKIRDVVESKMPDLQVKGKVEVTRKGEKNDHE